MKSALALLLAAHVLVLVAHGQEFDVASMRYSAEFSEDTFHNIQVGPARLDIRSAWLSQIIRWAYGITHELLSPDLQAWNETNPRRSMPPSYTIAATYPAGTTEPEVRLMLQRLLSDRSSLQLHRKVVKLDAYVASLKDGGLKGARFLEDDPAPAMLRIVGSGTERDFVATNVTMSDILSRISNVQECPIMDLTGLGSRRFNLKWKISLDSSPDPERISAHLVSLNNILKLTHRSIEVNGFIVDSISPLKEN